MPDKEVNRDGRPLLRRKKNSPRGFRCIEMKNKIFGEDGHSGCDSTGMRRRHQRDNIAGLHGSVSKYYPDCTCRCRSPERSGEEVLLELVAWSSRLECEKSISNVQFCLSGFSFYLPHQQIYTVSFFVTLSSFLYTTASSSVLPC